MLVTSREPLKFQAERVIRLVGLPAPLSMHEVEAERYSSVQLFVERAERAAGVFALTPENAPAVIQICQLLDGLPLGIVLAASQMYSQSPGSVACAIHENVDLLVVSMRDLPPRQRSIRAAFEWSWKLLTPGEQSVLAHLAIFRGGFTDDAVGAVSNASPAALASLVAKSLVREMGLGRYEMHETWRQMAGEKLDSLGSQALEETRHRHLAFFQQLAEAVQAELRSADQVVWLEKLEAEHDNMRAALRWAAMSSAVEQGLWLASRLSPFWRLRGYWQEGRAWLDELLRRDDAAVSPRARASALVSAAMLAWELGDYAATHSYAEESAALWRSMGHTGTRGLAYALLACGTASYAQTDYGPALALFDEAVSLFRRTNDQWGLGVTLCYLGATLMNRGDLAPARAFLEESRTLLQQSGDRWALTTPLNFLASIAWREQQYETARVHYEEVLAIRQSFRDQGGTKRVLNKLGELARYQGDYIHARTLYEECLTAYRELGSLAGVALLLHNLGQLEQHDGKYGQAAALFKESLGLYREQGNQLGVAMCLAGLGATVGASSMRAEPAKRAEGLSRAVVLFGVVESLLATLNIQFEPADRIEYERHLDAVGAELDQQSLDQAWAQSKTMTLAQAIEFAGRCDLKARASTRLRCKTHHNQVKPT
jgi:predicted ATPase